MTTEAAAFDEVTQQFTLAETPDVPGDCWRAAVASVLRKPLDLVPHFILFGDSWPQAFDLWLAWEGLRQHGTRTDVIPDEVCIVGGPSPRGILHACVGMNGRIVWDPHPSRDGLLSVTHVTVLRPRRVVDSLGEHFAGAEHDCVASDDYRDDPCWTHGCREVGT